MTVTEYAYTEQDLYTAIVQTAVPIALTADETSFLVADLIALAQRMIHDDPPAVWFAWCITLGLGYGDTRVSADWRRAVDRSAVLARQAAEYPSLKGGV